MECRLSKLLLMGIWWPVFEGRGGGGEFNFLPLLACAVWIAWLGIGGRLGDTPDYLVTESLLRKWCLIFGAA